MNTKPLVRQLMEQCRANLGTVILPEAQDSRTLEAVDFLLNEKVAAKIILLGDSFSIEKNLSLSTKSVLHSKIFIQDTTDKLVRDGVRKHFQKRQADKGRIATEEQLESIERDPLFQAGWLLAQDPTACVVAGAVATTADVIRAALGTIGLANGVSTVSGGFFMERYGSEKRESFYYADAGVIVDPTSEQLVDIAGAACETWSKIMKAQPVVAFLSFSTKGSAKHAAVDKVVHATKLFQARYPNIEADGELQFDAALVESIGVRKAPLSKVPGRANIFVFPDLNSGNIAYKITQRLGGFDAYGPILQGLARPYSDLSRGASGSDIAISALINLCRR